jgi:hypothetical protein
MVVLLCSTCWSTLPASAAGLWSLSTRFHELFDFSFSCFMCQFTPRRNPSSSGTLGSKPSLSLALVMSKVRTCCVYRSIFVLTSGSPPNVMSQYKNSHIPKKKHTISIGIFHTSCSVTGYPAALETKRAAPQKSQGSPFTHIEGFAIDALVCRDRFFRFRSVHECLHQN